MASTLSLIPTTDYHHCISTHSKPIFKSKFQSFSIPNPKSNISNFTHCSSTSNNSPISQESHKNPPKFGSFLTNDELIKLEFLQNYNYSIKLSSGQLTIRAMNDFEVDLIVELLAESFIESMLLPNMYLKVLGFLIRQYLVERRGLIPHAVTLIGFLRKGDENEIGIGDLVGTVEVSFDKMGANSSPPTPTPPKNFPYICNMTVKKEFRRRGIGWHLLKASEELISNMTSLRDVYLHCRLIDTAPFNMYIKAGYEVVKTDSFLILLTLQRRKHLMCKELPILSKPLETVTKDEEVPSLVDEEVPSLVAGSGSESLDEEVPSLVSASESEPFLFDEAEKNSPDMDKRVLASD